MTRQSHPPVTIYKEKLLLSLAVNFSTLSLADLASVEWRVTDELEGIRKGAIMPALACSD
jgi:hypothetical protein